MKHSRTLPVPGHYRVLFEAGSFSGLSDGELLAHFVKRESDAAELAFAALVERHASMVLCTCRSIVGNEHDAEDAFQATFLILATKAGSLRVRESLGPWLTAVAHRVSRGARAVALARAARELRAAQLAARKSGPESGGEVSSIVHEEIDRLPERYRLPLLLCDLESCTHHEAARRLGWPLGTVKSRQARARARLRARLRLRGFSGSLPVAAPFHLAHPAISESLIQSTARAAVGLLSRAQSGRAVSAAVTNLVTNSLRAMIVTRLTSIVGVVLLITAGIAASVLAQGQPGQKKPSKDSSPPSTTDRNPSAATPVFEYEIRIWKDGAPVTPTMKLKAHPGELSELQIPDGTFELRFRPRSGSVKSGGRPNLDRRTQVVSEMFDTQLEIVKLELALKAAEDAERMRQLNPFAEDQEQRIIDEFQRDPEVVALNQEIALAAEQRDYAKANSRQGNDPARRASELKYKKLMADYDKLWKLKYDEISTRLKAGVLPGKAPETIAALKSRLASLEAQKVMQAKLFEEMTQEHQEPKPKK